MRQTRAVTSVDRNISASLQSAHTYRDAFKIELRKKKGITHTCFSDKIECKRNLVGIDVVSSVWLFLKISICIMNTLIIDAICISSAGRNILNKLYSVIGHLPHLSLSVFVIVECYFTLCCNSSQSL